MKEYIRIDIDNALFFGHHGVNEEEKQTGQTFTVNVSYWLKNKSQDNLSKTVDYARVVSSIEKFFTDKRYNLLEQLVDEISDFLIDEYDLIEQVSVKVGKTSPAINATVSSVCATAYKSK